MREKIDSFKSWFLRNERKISAGALFAGFLFDAFTLQRIDLLYENFVFVSHLTIVAVSIFLINYLEPKSFNWNVAEKVKTLLPVLVQFSFGALFSGFFIFYSRSASLVNSWPFVLILLVLLLGNETFRERYKRLTFQVGIYFIAIFSYLIFLIPILINKIGAWVFIASGVISLLVISLFLYALSKVIPSRIQQNKKALFRAVSGIFIVINILYFTNLIPPIPLALKVGEVANKVERTGGEYKLFAETKPLYDFIDFRNPITIQKGAPAYFFSSVFAPADLNTGVVHVWQYFDKEKGDWVTESRISFHISGGRDEGYRGYTIKENIREGKWRVSVENSRGQVLGSTSFKVKIVDHSVYTSVVATY